MDINLVIVLLAIVAWHEILIAIGVALHYASGHSFVNLVIEFLDTADAQFLAILAAPDGQGSAPVARAAQIPVVEVLEPLAEASCARRLGLPVNGLVQFDHAVAGGRGADKPAVERVVEHGLVGAPAVRIVVHVLLNLECCACLLHAHADVDIQVFGLSGGLLVIFPIDSVLWVVGVLDPRSGVLLI